jgi:polar amino acid transport system ATP-binding protein
MTDAPVQLSLRGVGCHYGRTEVLRDITVDIRKGEAISFIGPSGSGKSTLLRTIVGLSKPSSGTITLDDRPIDYASRTGLASARNRMAIVFQQYNLFQNMTVMDNVTVAPIKVQGVARREAEERAAEILRRVGLSAKQAAYPDELSGGQQQRVAIARALMLNPEILLLDEVTSALDPELVTEVLDTVRQLAADGMTLLIVSHEMGFVREISDRVVMMDAGQIIEVGTATQIFTAPTAERTMGFVSKILRH